MERPINTIRTTMLAVGCSFLAATSVNAQDTVEVATPGNARIRTVSVIAGASQFDLSGTGTAPVIGARADVELNRWFVGEAAVSAMRPEERFIQRTTYLFPELQLQAQIPFSTVRPYVGLGAGFADAFHGSRGETARTATVAGGLRALLPQTNTMLRAELRVRGIGQGFASAMADWTLGLGRRF